ncbi:hypothetical protein [Tumebacillus amylolyticus]|nr:hypothetical protein [Tumebacillus amylolyticus]
MKTKFALLAALGVLVFGASFATAASAATYDDGPSKYMARGN